MTEPVFMAVHGNKIGALRISAVDSIASSRSSIDSRDFNCLALAFWWKEGFVFGNTQEEGLGTRLAILP
jgi:hypothetical protein